MNKLKNIYDSLTREQRSLFWNLTVTFIATIVTAWLGFTVVNSMQTNADKLEAKVLRYELIDRFYDSYDSFKRLTTEFKMEFVGRYAFLEKNDITKMSDEDKAKTLADVSNFLLLNKDKYLQIGDSVISIASRMHPYFSASAQNSLKDGILKIMVCKLVLEHYHDMETFDRDYDEMIYNFSMSQNSIVIPNNKEKKEKIKQLVVEMYDQTQREDIAKFIKGEAVINLTCMTNLVLPSILTIEDVFHNEIMSPKEKEPMSMWRTLLVVLFVGIVLYAIAIFCFVGRRNPTNEDKLTRLREEKARFEADLNCAKVINSSLQERNTLLNNEVKRNSKEMEGLNNKIEDIREKYNDALREIGTFREENERLKKIIEGKGGN